MKGRRAASPDDFETWVGGDVSPTLNVFDNATEVRATVLAVDQWRVRRLTPVECERLQGFPDHWTQHRVDAEQADSSRFKQIGNAVAVPVIEWIIEGMRT